MTPKLNSAHSAFETRRKDQKKNEREAGIEVEITHDSNNALLMLFGHALGAESFGRQERKT